MEVGILGLPQSGKSLLFEIMTGIRSRDIRGEPVRGQAAVPDPRLDYLASVYRPAKVTPAAVPLVDAHPSGERKWEALKQTFLGMDGLIHVIDGFTAADDVEVAGGYRSLTEELILADLQVVEGRLEKLARLGKRIISPAQAGERQLLERLRLGLEEGKTIRDLELSFGETFSLKGFGFWTVKPELIVINLNEGDKDKTAAFEKATGRRAMGICCELEASLGALSAEEQREYLSSLGFTEPAFARIVRGIFDALGQISFFTVGEDEVRAWVIPRGTRAKEAAGVIHNDLEKGFIKAEVVAYEDFTASGGVMARIKAAGRMRLEGKDYPVKDGDIITVRFNV